MEYILGWVVFNALLGYWLGSMRGQQGFGIAVSILLGPIGWVAILASKDQRPACSECGGIIVEGARKCRHCGSVIGSVVRPSRVPGVELRCPACGEMGFVPEVNLDTEVECPTCKRKFSAARAIV